MSAKSTANATSSPSTGNTLTADVAADIHHFFTALTSQPGVFFFNEADLQIHLAIYLKTLTAPSGAPRYDDVEVEYFVPIGALPAYMWNMMNGPKIDIVVRRGSAFVPVELKYSTVPVHLNVTRFGHPLSGLPPIVKHRGAQNLTRYGFWKDVKRLELLKRRFVPNVVGGIALFLTNDMAFTKQTRQTSSNFIFSMNAGPHGPKMYWQRQTKMAQQKQYQPFCLAKAYTLQWTPASISGVPFQYTLLKV